MVSPLCLAMGISFTIFNIITPAEQGNLSLIAHTQFPNSLQSSPCISWLDKHKSFITLLADHWVRGFGSSCLVLNLQAVIDELPAKNSDDLIREQETEKT